MKITHPVVVCSSLEAISVPSNKPPHGSEARSDWQNETLPINHNPQPEEQGRFTLFVRLHNSVTWRHGNYTSAQSPDKWRQLPLSSLSTFSYGCWPAALPAASHPPGVLDPEIA